MKNKVLSAAVAFMAAGGGANAQSVNDVFVIALENHNFTQPTSYTQSQQILGNPAAPYVNSLITPGNPNAAMTSYASNYLNVPPQTASSASGAGSVHPSEPTTFGQKPEEPPRCARTQTRRRRLGIFFRQACQV